MVIGAELLTEIEQIERSGTSVAIIGDDNILRYSSEYMNSNTNNEECCNRCSALRIVPERGDIKAVCLACSRFYSRSIEPDEIPNIPIPSYCPKKQ